jgi:Secretion system C-terminal sorting domain
MKKIALFCILLLCSMHSNAQITISNSTFPSVGDTLRYLTDPNPPVLNFGGSNGGPQFWDFSTLQGGNVREVIYQNPVGGNAAANFPNASLRTGNQAQETYYRTTATSFDNLGTSGADQLNLGINTTVRYQPPLPERRAPMNFFDINTFETDLAYAVSTGDLADSLLGALGALVDSFRFRIHTTRLDVVDGWGTCKIPGGAFDVLREKRTEISETSIDVHTLLGWTDLSGLLGGGGSSLLGNIGNDTTITYYYFSATEKEPIADVDVRPSDGTLRSVRYKWIDASVSSNDIHAIESKIVIYPNPTQGLVVVAVDNFPSEPLILNIQDVQGKRLKQIHFNGSQSNRVELDLAGLPAGILFCQILNEQGTILGVQKLVLR